MDRKGSWSLSSSPLFLLQIIHRSCPVQHTWRRTRARRPPVAVFIIPTCRRCPQPLAPVKHYRWWWCNRVRWRIAQQRTAPLLSTNPSSEAIRDSNATSETNVEPRVFAPMKCPLPVHRPMSVSGREDRVLTRRLTLVSRVLPMRMRTKLTRPPRAINTWISLALIPMNPLIISKR